MRAVLIGLVLLPAAVFAQEAARLSDLTVSSQRLPEGCLLSPTPSEKLEGNRVRSGLWAGLPSDPWIGTDAVQVASIASVFAPPARMPDGPPLNNREAALFRLRLAEGIEEGYEAVYSLGDNGNLLIVYGLRFPTVAAAQSFLRQSRFAQNPNAIQAGSIVALASSPPGDCLDAVLSHLRTLAR